MHQGFGNVGLSDGSVVQTTSNQLQELHAQSRYATISFAPPGLVLDFRGRCSQR